MVVIGAGGFAKELLHILVSDKYSCNKDNLFFFDDMNNLSGKPFFGKFTILNSLNQVKEVFQQLSPSFSIGIGSALPRYKMYWKFIEIGGKPKTIIDVSSSIGRFETVLGNGINIMQTVTISNDVRIGKGSLINTNVMIGHDVDVGDFCDIAPGVIITGHCKVGNYVEIGSGAIILPKVKIGNNSLISAGTVVSQDIPENSKVVGTIPSRVIEKLPPFNE